MKRRSFLATAGLAAFGGCTGFDDDSADDPSGPANGTETTGGNRSTDDWENETATEEDAPARPGHVRAKVDLHSHLRVGGGQAMADRYAELGFDALVGTDHSGDIDVPGGVTDEEVGDYSDLEFPGPVLNGVELSDARHVNVIESANEQLKQINHPMRYDDDATDIREVADRIGADLVEVTSHGDHLQDYPTVTDVLEDTDLSPTVTSDAHEVEEIGFGYVIVEVPEVTGDQILWALERGNYTLGSGRLW